jgi:hypothetical protein
VTICIQHAHATLQKVFQFEITLQRKNTNKLKLLHVRHHLIPLVWHRSYGYVAAIERGYRALRSLQNYYNFTEAHESDRDYGIVNKKKKKIKDQSKGQLIHDCTRKNGHRFADMALYEGDTFNVRGTKNDTIPYVFGLPRGRSIQKVCHFFRKTLFWPRAICINERASRREPVNARNDLVRREVLLRRVSHCQFARNISPAPFTCLESFLSNPIHYACSFGCTA